MPFAEVEGIRTYYQVSGSGQPLLLLSPLSDDASVPQRWRDRLWRGFKPAEVLSRDFQVITYDRRESGASGGRVEPLGWPVFARHAAGLLAHLGVERAFMLGSCSGTAVALALATEFPERCSALLLRWPVGGYHWMQRGRANFDRHIVFARTHGLQRIVELAPQSAMFWSDPEAGPWSSVLAKDHAFASAYLRQELEQYLHVVAQSRDSLFPDTAPAGITAPQMLTIAAPAFLLPGDDALHTMSAAHVLRELLPNARFSRLTPRQQNAANTERWFYESVAACGYARAEAAA